MVRIVSFNCNSIKNNNELVKCLLNDNDIVILQELMLSECDIDYLALLHPDYEYTCGVQDTLTIQGEYTTGRPSKGVAIMWRKQYSSFIKPLPIDNTMNAVIIFSLGRTSGG